MSKRGYALVDVFQPCVTYNKINTFKWFKENVYYLDDSHDPMTEVKYSKKAIEYLKFPLGILYINPNKTPYEDILSVYWEEKTPLYEREVDMEKLKALIESKRKI